MNNGLLHDILMLAPIENCLQELGADPLYREHHLGAYGDTGIVDLFGVLDGTALVIEAETSCTIRVLNDVRKANAVAKSGQPTRLIIVVPTKPIARAALRMFRRARQAGDLGGIDWNQIRPIVLTAGYCRKWICETFHPSIPRC